MRRREGDCQGSVLCRGPTWAGLLGWAQELMAGLPRSVSLEKEGRPLNWPPFQRRCRWYRYREPAEGEQRWGRPLGLGHLRQRRFELPRGWPRGRRPATRSRAERTQIGWVLTTPPSVGKPGSSPGQASGHKPRDLPGDAVTPPEVLGLTEVPAQRGGRGVLGDPHPLWSQLVQPVVWS